MTDHQPSCSTHKCTIDETLHYMGSQCNNGYVMEVCITCGKIFKLVSAPELEAKQNTIEEITGKLHTAHDLENKLCALLINHAGETGQSEGAVEVLERKLRELESLRAEVGALKKRIPDAQSR